MKHRMHRIFSTIFLLALVCAFPPRLFAQTMQIAAVVNDDAISMRDVEDRIKLVLSSSGLPDSKEIRAKIVPQIVEGLIEEQLKLQEARRNKLDVSQEEIDEGFATIAKQNNFTPEQFRAVMKQQGIPQKTLTAQIKAQLAWNKVVRDKLRRQVEVTESDVNMRLERLKGKIGQTEYLVSEIYLPLDNPRRNNEIQQFAQRMASELQAKKAPFGPVAAQFSKAAGADKGGTLGWIQQGDLEPALDKVLMELQEGEVSGPIKSGAGLYILYLQKKRTLTEESIPPKDKLTDMIGMERLDRVQQRALLDLKSSAFIDRRV
jgi:peptidyl-prolyl cis-trans isomerase SurA